ncbi:hypothetical protein GCM10017044_04700 [Kordiimonas sediminis]|uniref:Uncharacterized protein n=1 Tax=Kordiimonas sediminis TaxID=1735581 RepID=A0A919AK92_9PROT|nr:DUF5700 domain-containing putative Zn-dependent protease [Kordiimonas sediminis]GHF13683.1 hypothetical protein GCM10017044_04700 [Kordiimonas sediminis]
MTADIRHSAGSKHCLSLDGFWRQKFQTAGVVVLAFAGILASPVKSEAASIDIVMDTSFADEVLAEVCSNKELDRDTVAASPVVQDMLGHYQRFREYFTFDAYFEERQAAANCQKAATNHFRFHQIVDEREAITENLQQVRRVTFQSMMPTLRRFSPSDAQVSARAVPVLGTPSCGGWSGSDAFFVDLPCLRGDVSGLKYLAAHEIYHLIQKEFMYASDGSSSVDKFLTEMMTEGSATAIVDFEQIKKPGPYSQMNLRQKKTNDRRMPINFDLLNIAVSQMQANPDEETYRHLYTIGMSGAYDAPMYGVGRVVFATVVNHVDSKTLLCLMKNDPADMLLTYQGLADRDTRFKGFGPAVLEYLNNRDFTPCKS